MTAIHFVIAGSVLVNFAVGFAVFFANRKRIPNQQFFLASSVIGVWLFFVWRLFLSSTEAEAEFLFRWAQTLSLFIPMAIDGLRIAISESSDPWLRIRRNAMGWMLAILPVAILCHTRFFMTGATFTVVEGLVRIPKPLFGPAVFVWQGFYLAAWGCVITRYIKDLRGASGIRRAELQYPLLGCSLGALFGSLFGSILPAVSKSGALYGPLTPLCAVIMNLVIAYGIATRRILSVAQVIRRTTAYVLLATYLAALYLGVWWLSNVLLSRLFGPVSIAPNLLAAMAVAFSVAPAHGRMQAVANRLFVTVPDINLQASLQHAHEMLQSIGTVQELTARFAKVIEKATGAEHLAILLREGDAFVQVYPKPDPSASPSLFVSTRGILASALEDSRVALSADMLRRMPPSSRWTHLEERLSELQASFATGIYSKGRLDGILIAGPRLSGRIYSANELDALQVLCEQLGVVLENAKLYTEAENSRIYNNILLDSLVSGVVAATPEGQVTVFNREAQRITGLRSADVVGRDMSVLPSALREIMSDTLQGKRPRQDEDVSLALPEDKPIFVRLGSAVFRSRSGETIGVLLVFNDITDMKALQEQIRRSDRLASLGTLSAGMAHEIKNPLVTIKTFTQLLPERYEDRDFRDTFTGLVGDEVKRIDKIVSQLLTFARPAKPALSEIHVHEVLDNSLRLLQQEFHRKNIAIHREFKAEQDRIMGDANLLSQAFVNFVLNAHEAMQEGGTLTVRTDIASANHTEPADRRPRRAAIRSIRIDVEDTGVGIRQADLERIFDPFFTTKPQGTGLGLTVAHGIIMEQGGAIDVQSHPGEGTRISIRFPLLQEDKFG